MPTRSTPSTYLEQLNELPPRICFLLARKDRRKITMKQIAQELGWSLKKVSRFANLDSWDQFLKDVDDFRAACGITRKNERLQRAYVKRSLTQSLNGFNHVRKTGRLPAFLKSKTGETQI